MDDAQHAFDLWRHVYNHERPHEGIDLQVPIERTAQPKIISSGTGCRGRCL
jgi:transposase InsO family protein